MIYRETPYSLACQIFNQGIECDTASRIIRSRLVDFLQDVRDQVKKEMGDDYKPAWEQPIIIAP